MNVYLPYVPESLEDFARQDMIDTHTLTMHRDGLADQIYALEFDDEGNDRQGDLTQAEKDALHELRAEHDKIDDLLGEIDGYTGDDYATLVADDYFERYARDLAEEIGAIDPRAQWPLTYIDWERAADALKQDYTSIDIEGREYWYR